MMNATHPVETPRLVSISLTGRLLGALFTHAPDSLSAAPVLELMADADFASQWPVVHPTLNPTVAQMQAGLRSTDEPLKEAWQRLFIGPWALPAPPWGSVWLDRESVLFGESMLALRHWMAENGIACAADDSEPCDHIGTLLLLAAWLAEQGRETTLDELLAWHLLPWSGRFLEVFIADARHPYYAALGELTRLTLADWQQGMLLPVAQKTLYR
ncbi:Tat proofreading chaperone DmsD [Siccibacter turicensis]|uniref:Tat proofreading chaperone DmsD n=2 Tax=Siccibacter turicensis TaxID=357233 RepID=UPI0004670C0E|nr:Tat proofreading chaperone DmsD [Siccibacter turicensis]